jgi:hypothetical protein
MAMREIIENILFIMKAERKRDERERLVEIFIGVEYGGVSG